MHRSTMIELNFLPTPLLMDALQYLYYLLAKYFIDILKK